MLTPPQLYLPAFSVYVPLIVPDPLHFTDPDVQDVQPIVTSMPPITTVHPSGTVPVLHCEHFGQQHLQAIVVP